MAMRGNNARRVRLACMLTPPVASVFRRQDKAMSLGLNCALDCSRWTRRKTYFQDCGNLDTAIRVHAVQGYDIMGGLLVYVPPMSNRNTTHEAGAAR